MIPFTYLETLLLLVALDVVGWVWHGQPKQDPDKSFLYLAFMSFVMMPIGALCVWLVQLVVFS